MEIASLLCRDGPLCDFADTSSAHNEKVERLRSSASHPDFSSVSCDDDIPRPVKIYQSDESYMSLLITRVSSLCLKNCFHMT